MYEELPRDRVMACHWLLLRLAGAVPDDLTSQCRRWVAAGDTSAAGRAIAFAVLSQHIRLSDAEIDLLAELLGAADLDTSALSMLEVLDSEPMPKYSFAPGLADVDPGTRLPAADDRPGIPVIEAEPDDDVDRALLASIESSSAIRAVWRVWRYPGDGAPWPPPKRMYVVEADEGAAHAAVAATLGSVVEEAGDPHPQIEVYPVHGSVPSYQRLARAAGALIWARDPDPGLRLAVVYDDADERGPGTTGGHAAVAEPEATKLIEYLRGGEPLLLTTARMPDLVDPSRGTVVPINFRTDGHWIWSDASIYYLEQYGLSPDLDLIEHIERLRFVSPEVDGAAIHRALAALHDPPADEPAWTYGG